MTYVVNKRTHSGHLMSLIVKKHNQKKINSLEWGFGAFAQTSVCKYVLTTDCGTIFDPKCVYHLFNYMEANEDCVACTGRQRIMTAEQQANPNKNDKSDSLSESLLRRIQLLEYEVVHLTEKPTGNLYI